MRRVLVIVSVLLLVTLTSAAIIDELRALKQALSPKEPSYVQAEEKTKVTWNPAANCLEVNNIAGGWRKVRPAEIHDALVAEAAHFWQAVGAAPPTPRGKQNLAHHLKGAPGKRFRDNVNPGNNWPLNNFNNVYFPVTYPQLIRIAQAHPAYQNGGFVYGDSDFVRCGQWLMAIDSTSGPPRWYALPVAGIVGHHPAGVIQQGMQDSYAGMFDGATAGLGHEPVIADIRAVILNNVNNYDVHMCGLVYAQTIGEVRRNHITAIINPLIYDLINNVANYTPTSVLRGGKAAAGCKHPMARADSLAQVGAGVPPDGVGDNAVNYAPPLGGRAGTAAYELENEALVRWLTTVHAGNYRVAADCVNHAPAHVDAAKNAIRATIRGRVHVNMGNL